MDVEDRIDDGLLRWEPGTVNRTVLNRILQDAIADIWQDCHRDSFSTEAARRTQQKNMFREQVMAALYAGTGQAFQVM
jgi:hypothetical protein